MRELHGYHGEHRRHAHDAAADTHATRAHDGPKHAAAHDALKLRMLTDPAFRIAERLKHQHKAEAAEAEYAGKHAKPGDQGRAAEQRKPQEARPEHASPETRDKPATGIAKRRLEESTQAPDVAAREKPRLKEAAVKFWTAAGGLATLFAAEQFHLISPGMANEISKAIELGALGLLWRQGDRTENKDGNRPKD